MPSLFMPRATLTKVARLFAVPSCPSAVTRYWPVSMPLAADKAFDTEQTLQRPIN
jgi:hypothetical protein